MAIGVREGSDVERLLATFRHEPTDRIPTHEFLIDGANVSAILGKSRPKSWELSADEYVAVVTAIGMDCVGGPLFLNPRSILGGIRRGTLRSRDDLARMRREGLFEPTKVDRERLCEFKSRTDGTSIGLWCHLSAGLTAVYEAMGFETFCLSLYDDRELVEELLEMVCDDLCRVVPELVAAGFSFFHIGDDLGHKSGLIVPPAILEEIWKPRVARLVAPIRSAGVPMTFHSDGAIVEALPMIIDLGFSALNPIEPYGMDIYELKETFGSALAFIGNIDVAGPLAFGSAEDVRRDVREHVERLARGGGYVGATSHSVMDDIPPANFRAMVDEFHRYAPFDF